MINIIKDWNGFTIRQREDGYLSATDMCKACGKLFADWNKLDSTKEYLKALESRRYSDQNNGNSRNEEYRYGNSSNGNLIDIIQVGTPENQGTWVHRKVALRLAQWLSPEFAVQIDEWVEESMFNGYVFIRDNNAYKIALEVEQAVKTISDIENSHPIVYKLAMDSLGIDMGKK